MAKFYVQSGNFQTTINAGDAEKAALWVIHKVMEQVMPFFADDPVLATNRLTSSQHTLMVLGEVILVSEQGFGNPDQVEFDTFELQTQWQQLSVALSKLASMVLSGADSKHDEALCELV